MTALNVTAPKTKTSDRAAEITISLLNDLIGACPPPNLAVRLWDGTVWKGSTDTGGPARCTLVLRHPGALRKMLLLPATYGWVRHMSSMISISRGRAKPCCLWWSNSSSDAGAKRICCVTARACFVCRPAAVLILSVSQRRCAGACTQGRAIVRLLPIITIAPTSSLPCGSIRGSCTPAHILQHRMTISIRRRKTSLITFAGNCDCNRESVCWT